MIKIILRFSWLKTVESHCSGHIGLHMKCRSKFFLYYSGTVCIKTLLTLTMISINHCYDSS
jgi:hypothetical protein